MPRPVPTSWLRLMNLLASLEPDERPPNLCEQVLQAHDHAHERPDTRQALFELEGLLARGDPEEVRRIELATAEMLIEHALRQEHGLAREYWLREALTVATQKKGAASARDRIRHEIEHIGSNTYDLQTTTVETELPAEDVEAWLDGIVGTMIWMLPSSALRSWVARQWANATMWSAQSTSSPKSSSLRTCSVELSSTMTDIRSAM